jgi:hypothetical protein
LQEYERKRKNPPKKYTNKEFAGEAGILWEQLDVDGKRQVTGEKRRAQAITHIRGCPRVGTSDL